MKPHSVTELLSCKTGKFLKIDTPQNICNSFPVDLYEVKTENIPALYQNPQRIRNH